MWQALFFEGGAQMIIAEVIMAALLATYFGGQSGDTVPYGVGVGVLVVVCVFVAGFAWSWGPLGWLVGPSIPYMQVQHICRDGAELC